MAKSLWLTCLAYCQPMLRADLTLYVEVVEEKYENNSLQTLKTKSLDHQGDQAAVLRELAPW